MSRDMWWMDREDEEQEEYEEYFDVERRMWVRVPKKVSENAPPQGPLSDGYRYEDAELGGYDASPAQGYTALGDEEKSRGDGESGDDGWVTFESPAEDMLRGSGRRPKRIHTASQPTGLKLYMVLSLFMAGALAASGRFIESGVVAVIAFAVYIIGRWM
jgi:hypothetical protein